MVAISGCSSGRTSRTATRRTTLAGSHAHTFRSRRLFGSGAPRTDREADPFSADRDPPILLSLFSSRFQPRVLVGAPQPFDVLSMPRQARGEPVCHSELVPVATHGIEPFGQALLIEIAAEACAQCVVAFDTKCVDELMVASARLYAECVPRRVLQRRLRTW